MPDEQASNMGCVLLVICGFVPALLHSSDKANRVQCDGCGYIFRQPGLPATSAGRLSGVILFIIGVAAFFASVLFSIPDIADPFLPESAFLQNLGQTVAAYPETFILFAFATAALIVLACFIATCGAYFANRRRMSKKFEMKPK